MANAFYVIGKFGAIRAIYDAPTGYTNLDLGTVTIGGDQISITGAAWDPVGSKLYGVTRTVDPIYPKSLVEINPADPTNSTLIGALGTANSCTDITCSPSGQLFGYTAGNNGRLVSINKTTGVASNVGGLGPGFSGGIAFSGSTCYYITANLGDDIYTVNTSTGVFTDTGIVHTTGPFSVEALEYHDGVMYGGGANNYYVDINLATGVGSGISFVTVSGISDVQALVSVPIPPAPSPPSPPANDSFANAQALPGNSGIISGTLVGSSIDWPSGDPGIGPNVWFKWTAPKDGIAVFTSPDIGNIYLYTGSTFGSATFYANAFPYTEVSDGVEYHIEVTSSEAIPFDFSWSLFDEVKPINTEVSVAFYDNALTSFPTWVQIDDPNPFDTGIPDIVSGFRIDRGRASEFDKTGSGTATIDIIDTEGTVDPTNPSGPFYGYLDPMKPVRIRLRNPVTDTFHYLFNGFASEWSYAVDISGAFTKATLDCADAFDLLAALEMTPGHHGDTPPANSLGDIFFQQGPPGTIGGVGPSRIHKALDDAGWPVGAREVFPGNVLLQETIYARRDQLLSVIFDAADAEFPGVANVYINKVGDVTFHGRYTRFDPTNPDYGIQFWKVGTGPIAAQDSSIAPISGLTFRRSKSDIINAAMSVPQLRGGGEWTTAELATMLEKDDASIAQYGWRSDSFDNLLTYKGRTTPDTTSFPIKAVDETKLFSKWRVENYSQPHTRIDQIVFRPQQPDHFSAPAIWALMCEIEIGDIVTVMTDHPGGGGFNDDFFVEGIHYDVTPGPLAWPDVTLTIDVSPRSLYAFNPFGMEGAHAAVIAPTRPAAIGPLSIIGGRLGGKN